MTTFADVKREYEKNKELKKEHVQLIRDWAMTQPHLPKISELALIIFLHSCYYNIESTKKCIETFYTLRAQLPEFFKNRNPSTNAKLFENEAIVLLPKRTPQGYQVFYCKLLDVNPSNFDFEGGIKHFDMVVTLMLHQAGTAPGQIILVDAAGMTFRHVLKISLTLARKFFFYLQEALPIRLKKFIIINTPYSVHKFLMLIRPFFSKELANNFQTYTDNIDEVFDLIPKENLPSDYGGEADSVTELTIKINENLLAHESFFVEGEKDIADESKRIGKPKTRNTAL